MTRLCLLCDKPLPENSFHTRKYCSDECSKDANRKKSRLYNRMRRKRDRLKINARQAVYTKKRYAEDPEFRAKCLAKSREWWKKNGKWYRSAERSHGKR